MPAPEPGNVELLAQAVVYSLVGVLGKRYLPCDKIVENTYNVG